MLASLALSSLAIAIPAFSADGIIVINRDVQPRIATRPTLVPDPNPQTVNVNPSATVIRSTNAYELSDNDFAGITSGASLQGGVLSGGQLPGLSAVPNATQSLQNMSGGRTGGSVGGTNISNQVNRSLQQGLAPLKILTGDR